MYVLPFDRLIFFESLFDSVLLDLGLNGFVGLTFGNSDLWVDDLIDMDLLFSLLEKRYLRTS